MYITRGNLDAQCPFVNVEKAQSSYNVGQNESS